MVLWVHMCVCIYHTLERELNPDALDTLPWLALGFESYENPPELRASLCRLTAFSAAASVTTRPPGVGSSPAAASIAACSR
eukprot:COSAG04_NODE_28674_length_274_cov_0.594286_1_plen_80_part_01